MKVFEIVNLDTGEKYFVSNKIAFCKDFNLTRRLLDYTRSGERHHHKRFVLKPHKLEFIKSEDGDKILYGTEIKGYVVSQSTKIKSEEEIISREMVVLKKQLQSYQDKLRIARKAIREQNRTETIQESFVDDVEAILLHKKFYFDSKVKHIECEREMLIQLSDLHFGKVVNLEHNKYNLTIAKERMLKYANSIIEYGKIFKVKNVAIAITGDIFNLDTHMDSLLTNSDNRANCFVGGFDIMIAFLHKISSCFNVRVQGVLGNESRVRTTEYNSNVNKIASNNFDTLLFKILKRVCHGVEFIGDGDKLHDIVNVKGKNIAICHGDKFKHTKDEIYKFKARMMEQSKEQIDFVIFGHIHSTYITPTFARSGSLVGADEYAYNGLNISESVASQNIYIIDDVNITPIEIKL